MPTPPLRKAHSASPRRGRATQRTIEPVSVSRPGLKPATEQSQGAHANRAAEDFAFTQDPLSGSVTLHVGRNGTRRVLQERPVGDATSAGRHGLCATDTDPRGKKSSNGAPETWSDLEPDPTPIAQSEPKPIIAPVPNPDAVH